jgi:diphthine-ammonia ligase
LQSTQSLPLTSIASISLFLSSMDLFPAVNAVYKTFFGVNPPTRACVAVPLPIGERVRLEAVAFAGDEKDRKALHVQSLSYWAPANIGPYSQSIIVRASFPFSRRRAMPSRTMLSGYGFLL